VARCHAGSGCAIEDIVAALGMTTRDLFDEPIEKRPERRIAATYQYTDEVGTVLYEVVRHEPKDFRQRRPDGHGGWDLEARRRPTCPVPPARLIAGIKAGLWVVIAEGEKGR